MSLPLEQFDTNPKAKKVSRLNVLPSNPDICSEDSPVFAGRFPKWLHRRLPEGNKLWQTSKIINTHRLATVCEEARCPNLLECYSKKTATFLALGKECTRACGFCSIDFSKQPQPPQADEPQRIAHSVQELGLKHVVITMVARDDLEDGGAGHIVKIVEHIRKVCSEITIELLTSDFQGKSAALETVLSCRPEIFNHNLETVRELTPRVRHKATYERSLEMLRLAKELYPNQMTKSGLMVGLGETKEQILHTLKDLARISCDIVTIGQYLQSDHRKIVIKEFITPETFKEYEIMGKELGIANMYSAPFVRSSYNANLFVQAANGSLTHINSH